MMLAARRDGHDVVCGVGSTYDGGTNRDVDWYRVSQAELLTAAGGN